MSPRRRGRTQRAANRPNPNTDHYRHPVNPFEPLRILADDAVERLHNAAVGYLADEGIRVLLPEAREIFQQGGATVDGDMVRISPHMVADAIETAPSTFTIEAPNPDRSVEVGGRNVAFLPVGGPPFVSDLAGGRRSGTMADQENFLRLAQSFDVLAGGSPAVEPTDIPVNVRHLHSGRATMVLTDKIPFIYPRGRARVRDNLELVKIRYGITTDAELAQRPRCWTNINTNSPRQLDIPMAMAIIDFARLGQPCIMTPFTLAGAMAPVTLAGALALQHMEALAAITLAQLSSPGAPVMYGAFTSNVDMQSGSPAFGTPETFKAAIISGQLARFVGVPWRSSAASGSNTEDAQGGYETMMSMFGALLGGANWIQHAAGWQEGGLTASYEKYVIDIEMCQMLVDSFAPVAVSDETLALDAITEVGPGGHFFGTPHTLARFADAFYRPLVFGRQNFESWTESGSPRTEHRAADVIAATLNAYQPPPVDESIRDQIDQFVKRRVAEGGAPPD